MLDPGVLKYPGGGGILESVQTSDLRYDIQPQVYPNIVTFWREVTEVREVGSTKVSILAYPLQHIWICHIMSM